MRLDWFRNASAPTVPGGTSVQEIAERIAKERRRIQIQAEDARAADDGVWPRGCTHAAPDHRLSVEEAHESCSSCAAVAPTSACARRLRGKR
ncbi:hypothetical protein [Nocardia goodfellowii]|uniref:DksA C4-type domain-containing protein n=1 Tax=Nocardia goodfellowii TaxID=882446 RepID=A0ABS4Q9W4_9NOCA|nr:hypothetical protein [Nocardia goodfellowii]MBP2188492.1 hypothetical protein [Nocardia goodfellowii]